ncbi:MAG: dTDP-4-dehydrorhamnose reductase [Lactobacillales bacterium]|jgi:dTDP-4-dehydrorhamnose reductase|nr:dTDP-4-dehydrorhamnose reductase [Lactobacillales bacterium]
MILVTGANGQLGRELVEKLEKTGMKYIATDYDTLDITDEDAVFNFFENHKPILTFHCAAYTAVDKAEDEGKEDDYLVNVVGTKNIARAVQKNYGTLVFISTDYVFDGELPEGEEYTPTALTNPLSEYGRTKAEAEKMVETTVSNYYIIRTSWVFGQYGKNFVKTMLNLASTRDELTVVADEIGRPTWTDTLADFMIHLIRVRAPHGVYHLSNEGIASWYDFAAYILEDKDVTVSPVTAEEFYGDRPHAVRPKRSVMDLTKAKETGFKIPNWKRATTEMIKQIEID